jgi:beta-fructofuranosidase
MGDPSFPHLHGRPARGWLNDPNGLCRVDGRYHVFFQHNPDAAVHGAICWGHVSSPDLLHWSEHPIALRPSATGLTAGGCWSGCVVDEAGLPTAVYTAVPDGDAGHAVVALARSDRTLEHWEQDPRPGPGRPDDGSVTDVRDPFLFTFEGHRYAVQGAGRIGGPPCLLLWGCDDLTAWVPLGSLLDSTDPLATEVAPAHIWECPNLVEVDGTWVLLVSIWRFTAGASELVGVRYLLGDLEHDGAGLRFRPTAGGVLDDGPAFYAPQVLVDGDRVLLWGWAWELDRTPAEVEAAGWAGVLTFPRELTVENRGDGPVLVSAPAAELTALRRGRMATTPTESFSERAFEVVATGPARLELTDGDAARTIAETSGSPTAPARMLVDGSMIEVFTDGRSWTGRGYPGPSKNWRLVAEPDAVTVHRLGLADGGD